MKNEIASRGVVTVPAPASIDAGDLVKVGSLVGVAFADAANGAPVEVATVGEFRIAKASGEAWTIGAPIYWDASAGAATVDDDTAANDRIGTATAAAISAAVLGSVLLTPGAA
jgi:predicted RecA/RadA family phage recombinase